MKHLILIITLLPAIAFATGPLRGILTDGSGNPIPYANVYVKNTTYGVSTNLKGEFVMELEPGTHIICFSSVGFLAEEREISIQKGAPSFIRVSLQTYTLAGVEIVSDRKDMARSIMQKVRDQRSYYQKNITGYSCETYTKTSIERELVRIREPKKTADDDTVTGISVPDNRKKKTEIKPDTSSASLSRCLPPPPKKERMNLIERHSKTHFRAPGTFKEEVLAYRDYVTKRQSLNTTISMGTGMNLGEHDIAPMPRSSDNPYILYENVSSCDFNFYNNLIDYPAICQKSLVSPIAFNSQLYYTYNYERSFEEGGHTIYEIKATPIFREDALFEGSLYVADSIWAIVAIDLKINSGALFYCSEFRIIQNYEQYETNTWLPARREIIYTIKEGKYDILGNSRIRHTNYQVNPDFPSRFFNNEIRSYATDAFDKDTVYWKEFRPISLNTNEIEFIRYNDSLADYYSSEAFFARSDSIFNSINWWFWLTGVGHRNRTKGTEWYIEGLLNQINPFGIGGYRHRLPGYFNKDFKNDMLLETRGFIDYGFRNKDVKGKVGAGLTYLPLKFVRTFIEVGDYYEMVNSYASISQTFSRSNYVRTKTISIAQRAELFNGFYAELTFSFSDQDPLTNIQLEQWSEKLFGSLNEPTDFIRYKKSEIRLDGKYRIKQKYVIRGKKKTIIGTDYPELKFTYRKGVKGFLGSEVNYDYLELGAKGGMKPGRLGTTRWDAQAGSFVNKKNLRVLEYKYFRGSDRFFFSDPLRSFQLMGPAFNTPDEYFRANIIHHFEGSIMNKIPLINLLKLELAAGAGTLVIPDSDFTHFEMFAGIERVFRIKKQLFRFGLYAVSSDNTLEKADFTLKVGLDFFNSYTNKWNY